MKLFNRKIKDPESQEDKKLGWRDKILRGPV